MHRNSLDKQEKTAYQDNRWEEMIKISAEINEIEMKRNQYKESKKGRLDSLKRLVNP